ncbi:WbqC family protein [Marinobacter sp. C2H3]|uniref:WbqC family protein n=1 Tax=Marinobacter sp. C2H3 TaxID=3119003 RepID=UPI00300F1AFE
MTTLGAMQPYFFPYIGYFQLMASVDTWVFFDRIQFVNKGWVNRNRILHPDPAKEWQFMTVPLAGKSRFDAINDIAIAQADWRGRIRGQLSFLKRRAPCFAEAMDVFDHCVDVETENLSVLVCETLRRMAGVLDLAPEWVTLSGADLPLGDVEHAGQWALRLAEALGATRYLNPAGGAALFRQEEFDASGIELAFHEPLLTPYEQGHRPFVPGLSILDVLLWNGVSDTRRMVQQGVFSA